MGPLHLWPEVLLTSLPPSSRPDSSLALSCPDPYSPLLGGWGPLIQHLGHPARAGCPSHSCSPDKQEVGHEDRRRPLPRDAALPHLHPWSRSHLWPAGPGLSSKAGAPGAQLQKCGVLVVGGCPTFRCSGPFALPGGPGPAQVTSGAQRSSPGRASRSPESCSSTLRRHASASGAQAAHL